MSQHDAPHPLLRIVPTESLHPHEEHDSQRAVPLADRLRHETHMINPPVVAPMTNGGYCVLDGANRFHAFSHLGYPHIVVQVVDYETAQVALKTWHHVVGGWSADELLGKTAQIHGITLTSQPNAHEDGHTIAQITLPSAEVLTLRGGSGNAQTRAFVALYQRMATLHRTALDDDETLWTLYPDATAIIRFAQMSPVDIVTAAQQPDYLPPGISRHIVHGRAIRVNYPLDALRDPHPTLEAKNAALLDWVRGKLAQRQIRYYAEATYQFDE